MTEEEKTPVDGLPAEFWNPVGDRYKKEGPVAAGEFVADTLYTSGISWVTSKEVMVALVGFLGTLGEKEFDEKKSLAILDRARIAAAKRRAKMTEGKGPGREADTVAAVIDKSSLFHSPEGDVYADIDGHHEFTFGGEKMSTTHKETYAIERREFRSYLVGAFREKYKRIPTSQSVSDAIVALDDWGCRMSVEQPVFLRVSEILDLLGNPVDSGPYYIDLGGPKWENIEITADQWRVVNSSEGRVHFYRPRGMYALPVPEGDGDISVLRQFLNVDDDSWVMIVSWILGALAPRGPYPILVIEGEQGSAKSMTSRLVGSVVDPSKLMLRTLPREERDLMVAARNSWVLAFDNLTRIPDWYADAFCRLSTGGGMSVRKLYEDVDEVTFDYLRPLILNGIEGIATRSDLQDRSLVVILRTIYDKDRQRERQIVRDFQAALPVILSGFLDACCAALRVWDEIKFDSLPRMADFAAWVLAAEREGAVPWEKGLFMDVYSRNREEAIASNLEASALAMAVVKAMGGTRERFGPAAELLEELTESVAETIRKGKRWPKSPSSLSGQLRRIAPLLRRSAGLDLEQRRTVKGTREIRIFRLATQEGEDAVPEAEPSEPTVGDQPEIPF